MNVRMFQNVSEASCYAAAIVEQVIRSRERPVLGLATGSTPLPVYQRLVDFHHFGLSFSKVTTLNLDEYVGLATNHSQSYRTYMKQNLFNRVDIPEGQTHYLDGGAKDLEAECHRYDDVLRQHPIDLQILGIGVNGHIGFNEPDEVLKANTHVVHLSDETITANSRFFEDLSAVPKRALTMGLQSILLAKQILLLAFGDDKRNAVTAAIQGDVNTSVPASLLQLHPNVTVILDVKSGAGLK